MLGGRSVGSPTQVASAPKGSKLVGRVQPQHTCMAARLCASGADFRRQHAREIACDEQAAWSCQGRKAMAAGAARALSHAQRLPRLLQRRPSLRRRLRTAGAGRAWQERGRAARVPRWTLHPARGGRAAAGQARRRTGWSPHGQLAEAAPRPRSREAPGRGSAPGLRERRCSLHHRRSCPAAHCTGLERPQRLQRRRYPWVRRCSQTRGTRQTPEGDSDWRAARRGGARGGQRPRRVGAEARDTASAPGEVPRPASRALGRK